MGTLLRCEHADFGYENQDAVVDANLEVNTGDYICIVGENGSGKSTLMKGILGLLKPTSGKIVVSEELRRAGIGYLPQQTAAQKDFPATVYEVVISGCLGKRGNRPFYSRKERALAECNMEKLGITDLKKQCYRELSGGQQQRTAIARSLIYRPALLLADEPTGNLDTASSIEIMELFTKLHQEGATVVLVTHEEDIAAFARRIICFGDGKILSDRINHPVWEKGDGHVSGKHDDGF